MTLRARPSALLNALTKSSSLQLLLIAIGWGLLPSLAEAVPNGTWLSKPQIWYYTSTNTLDQALARIRAQQYRIVFLDYRNVSDADQRQVSQKVRQQGLVPVVWIQTPQYRSLTVPQLVYESRNGDGIQIDDHFFTHYSQADFYALRSQYTKRIYCSIQPFQADKLPPTGCNELDVQCYVPESLKTCLKLVDRLQAVASLSLDDTFRYRQSLEGRPFNVFLWPSGQ
jgi:hypothetical protein